MKHLNLNQIRVFVNKNITVFQENKLRCLENLTLNSILNNKNFYLYKANRIYSVWDLIHKIFGDFLSSLEENSFDSFLKDLSVFISNKAYNGKKSSFNGIDLEFEKNNTYYLVSINSGFNPINTVQQIINFRKSIKALKVDGFNKDIQAIIGICFGKNQSEFFSGYQKIIGGQFWHFISGNNKLFAELINPLAYIFYEETLAFYNHRVHLENRFVAEFMNEYCTGGAINWEKLVAIITN